MAEYTGSTATPLNITIPKNTPNGATSTITLSGSGGAVLQETDIIQVVFKIDRAACQNLDIFLVAPDNAGAMLLSSDNGSTSVNAYNTPNTMLRTDLSNVIGSAGNNTPPLNNPLGYRPEGTISTPPNLTGAGSPPDYLSTGTYAGVIPATSLLGASIDGTWTFFVGDDKTSAAGNAGRIINWALTIIRPEATTLIKSINDLIIAATKTINDLETWKNVNGLE